MSIDEITLGDLKGLRTLFNSLPSIENVGSHSLPVGEKVFVRTVTHYYTGKLVAVTDSDLVLEDAAWVADTGRWANALKDGTLNEIEPFVDPVYVSRAAVVDVTKWRHPLPREQK